MSNYIVDGSDLTSVANAIRAKSGGSGQLAFPAGFVSEIGNIPTGGGGGGLTVIASGTFVGSGNTTDAGRAEFSIGKKLAVKDYFLRVKVKSADAEFDRSTSYAFVWFFGLSDGAFGHWNPNNPDNNGFLPFASDFSVSDNNSGVITSKDAGSHIATAAYIRNGAVSYLYPNVCRPKRKTVNGVESFYFYIGQGNAAYSWTASKTFEYELVYYGSNPSTDIVTIS